MMGNYIKENMIIDKLIVFDTSILLNFYYYDKWELNSINKFLLDISSYIWVPFHVQEEFKKGRERKINEVIKNLNELKQSLKKLTKNNQNYLENYKRNRMIDNDFFQKYTADFNCDINQRYSTQMQNFEKNLKRLGSYKYEKQDILLKVLSENVFSKYDEFRNLIIKEYLKYYEKFENFPGKEDLKKDDNKYGDFIIWITMILKAKNVKKDIIFVTGEKKQDWCDKNGNCHEFYINMFKEQTRQQFIFLDFNGLIKKITNMKNFDILHNFIQGRYFYKNTIKDISPYKNEYSSLAIQDIVMNGRKVELHYLLKDKIEEWKLLLMTREFIDYKFEKLICGGIEAYRYALALPVFTFNCSESCKLLCKIIAIYVTTDQEFNKKYWEISIETGDSWYKLPENNYLDSINHFLKGKLDEKERNNLKDTNKFDILKFLLEIKDVKF